MCYYDLVNLNFFVFLEEKLMKKSILSRIAAGALASMMLLTGCGSQEKKSKADDSLQKVKDKGEFLLGLDATFKPMGYTDENGEIVGFDIDVAEEVCKRMDVKLVKVGINWDTKEMELDSGTIDCIWNGMSVNPERTKKMNLSDPYMNNDMIFCVNGSSEITSKEQLSGKTVAVQNGSTAQTILSESEIGKSCTVKGYETNLNALMELELGLVDAVFLDSVVANYEITTGKKDYKVLTDGLSSEEYAIGFRKNDQKLRDEVQKILCEMKADGTLAEISNKWFGSDVTTVSEKFDATKSDAEK